MVAVVKRPPFRRARYPPPRTPGLSRGKRIVIPGLIEACRNARPSTCAPPPRRMSGGQRHGAGDLGRAMSRRRSQPSPGAEKRDELGAYQPARPSTTAATSGRPPNHLRVERFPVRQTQPEHCPAFTLRAFFSAVFIRGLPACATTPIPAEPCLSTEAPGG